MYDPTVLLVELVLLGLILWSIARSIRRIRPGSLGTVYVVGAFRGFLFPGVHMTSVLARVVVTDLGSLPIGRSGDEGVLVSTRGESEYDGIVLIHQTALPAKFRPPLAKGAGIRVLDRSPLGVVTVVPSDLRPVDSGDEPPSPSSPPTRERPLA